MININHEIGLNQSKNRIRFDNIENKTAVLTPGTISVPAADQMMQKMRQLRSKDRISDTLLMLSHPPSLTIGARNLNLDDLLQPLEFFAQQGIHLYQNTRGGGLTYHWQGQLVCYPILKLKPGEQNIRQYMFRLEEVALRTLSDFGIYAERRREQTAQIGLWVGNYKIASMGIHISNWITSFGFALNLFGDLSPANYIRPCGLENVRLITIEDITGIKTSKKMVINSIVRHFQDVFLRKIDFNGNNPIEKRSNDEN